MNNAQSSTHQPVPKCKFRLEMVRGQRTVFIGEFFTKYRVAQMPGLLEWDGSWTARITNLKEGDQWLTK